MLCLAKLHIERNVYSLRVEKVRLSYGAIFISIHARWLYVLEHHFFNMQGNISHFVQLDPFQRVHATILG